MPCPTCNCTVQKVNDGVPRVFWCPTCGTLKTEGGVPDFEAPAAVDAARTFLIFSKQDGTPVDGFRFQHERRRLSHYVRFEEWQASLLPDTK